MTLSRLIYSSRPFGFDQTMLNGILLTARTNNERDGITGALICRADVFVQYLEGPQAELAACYGRIRRDDRHLEVHQHLHEPITARLFGDWAMLDDPVDSLIWDREAVRDGAVERASGEEILTMFGRLRSEAAG